MLETPKTPEGTRIYAIGDIHGRADLLCELHTKIATDLAKRPVASGVLIHLGDYIDRGPSSKKVIDHLIEKPLTGLETINLKGNHEESLLSFYKNSEYGNNWLLNGGGETLKSYGIEVSDDPFQESLYLDEIHANFLNHLPETHLAFLNNLVLQHREGDYLFVHAGLRPGVALESQSDEDLMWIRSDFLFSDADFGFMVVHGHSPRSTPVVRNNRIGIDTMAYRSGCLTCLVLEGTERHFISTEVKRDRMDGPFSTLQKIFGPTGKLCLRLSEKMRMPLSMPRPISGPIESLSQRRLRKTGQS